MRRPFTLVQDTTTRDTMQCLEHLTEPAKAGQLIGLAYAAIYKRRNFSVNACGEANRSPTFARGVVAALDDELGQRVRG